MIKQILLSTFYFLLFTAAYGASVDSVKVIEKGGVLEVYIFTDASQYRDFIPDIPYEQPMIAIDFFNAQHNMPSTRISVMKGNLLAIRSSQYARRVTRVVLDIKKLVEYRVYREENGVVVRLSKLEGQAKGPTKTKSGSRSSLFYSSRGKRDPFKPLIGSRQTAGTLLDVEHAVLKGIMWSPKERYALLQDEKGRGYILQEGDKVSGGKVLSIRKREVIFELYGFGKVNRVRLEITSKEKK